MLLILSQSKRVISLKVFRFSSPACKDSLVRIAATPKSDGLILEGLQSQFEKRTRPPHIGIPRKRFNELPFAVMLMRSSYSALDEMDCIAMDEFQQKFFNFRQSEWQDYLAAHPRVLQGDLADAVYFDFISFAQYATISWVFKNAAKMSFIEKFNAAGDTQVVNRPPKLINDSLLPYAFRRLVGNKMLNFLFDKYPPQLLPPSGIPPSTQPLSFDTFISYAQMILDVFSINCYALDCNIQALSPEQAQKLKKNLPNHGDLQGESFFAKITLRAPATLWSSQVLRNRKNIVNNFEIIALESLARRYGHFSLSLISTTVSNQIDVTHVIMVTPGTDFDAVIDDAIASIPEQPLVTP